MVHGPYNIIRPITKSDISKHVVLFAWKMGGNVVWWFMMVAVYVRVVKWKQAAGGWVAGGRQGSKGVAKSNPILVQQQFLIYSAHISLA